MMNESRRIIFFGTGAHFSLTVLRHLVELGVRPCAVVVSEYPAADSMPVLGNIDIGIESKKTLAKIAEALEIPLLFAPGRNHKSLAVKLKSYAPDFILVACWPYLLSEEICATASKAALNLHPSLLPNYRGANPVEAQLQSGEKQLGVSLHLLSQVFDSGDIVGQYRIEAGGKTLTVEDLEKQAAHAGVKLFIDALNTYGSSQWQPYKQTDSESGSAF